MCLLMNTKPKREDLNKKIKFAISENVWYFIKNTHKEKM